MSYQRLLNKLQKDYDLRQGAFAGRLINKGIFNKIFPLDSHVRKLTVCAAINHCTYNISKAHNTKNAVAQTAIQTGGMYVADETNTLGVRYLSLLKTTSLRTVFNAELSASRNSGKANIQYIAFIKPGT